MKKQRAKCDWSYSGTWRLKGDSEKEYLPFSWETVTGSYD